MDSTKQQGKDVKLFVVGEKGRSQLHRAFSQVITGPQNQTLGPGSPWSLVIQSRVGRVLVGSSIPSDGRRSRKFSLYRRS